MEKRESKSNNATAWNLKGLFKSDDDSAMLAERKAVEKANYDFINKWKGREDYLKDAKVLKKEYQVWEEEAIRVVSNMPDWKPGSQNGKPIDVILQLPIDFSVVKKN